MRPIIQRIAQKRGHDLGILAKFFPIRRRARYKRFVYAAQTHGAPLVMVGRQPQFAHVRKRAVRADHRWIEVAMVIDHGQILYLGVQLFGRGAL